MAAMTFTSLTAAKTEAGSIARWVNKSNLPAEEIVADAENWLGEFLRVRGMMTRTTITLAEDANTIDLADALPSFLDPVAVKVQGSNFLIFVPEDEIDEWRDEGDDGTLQSDEPGRFSIIGDTMLFDTTADQDYTLIVIHFARPTALSSENGTNLYTTRFRALMKYACMGFAYEWLKDEKRASERFQAAMNHMNRINETDDLVRRGMSYEHYVN